MVFLSSWCEISVGVLRTQRSLDSTPTNRGFAARAAAPQAASCSAVVRRLRGAWSMRLINLPICIRTPHSQHEVRARASKNPVSYLPRTSDLAITTEARSADRSFLLYPAFCISPPSTRERVLLLLLLLLWLPARVRVVRISRLT